MAWTSRNYMEFLLGPISFDYQNIKLLQNYEHGSSLNVKLLRRYEHKTKSLSRCSLLLCLVSKHHSKITLICDMVRLWLIDPCPDIPCVL